MALRTSGPGLARAVTPEELEEWQQKSPFTDRLSRGTYFTSKPGHHMTQAVREYRKLVDRTPLGTRQHGMVLICVECGGCSNYFRESPPDMCLRCGDTTSLRFVGWAVFETVPHPYTEEKRATMLVEPLTREIAILMGEEDEWT